MILAGGGGDTKPLDELFAKWTGNGRMLFIPIADDVDDYAAHEVFIRDIYEPLGVSDIEMWTTFPPYESVDLSLFESIYIGGGNTYKLLHLMRQSGFDKHLTDFVTRGGAVSGSSAGAIILGSELQTVAHLDENYINLADTRGLDLANGYGIWCHYTEQDDPLIEEFLNTYENPVLAVPEGGGIIVEGSHMKAWGHVPSVQFAKGYRQIVEVGAEVLALPAG